MWHIKQISLYPIKQIYKEELGVYKSPGGVGTGLRLDFERQLPEPHHRTSPTWAPHLRGTYRTGSLKLTMI